ncbi:ABC transporter permease [Pseudonocardia sp. GCM10023141]|uniref:ABC transporter permease n=1 Tax=Pseudonocardia sp. GCM10023141 TaxID=3252653 RepID=UPI0036087854
MIWVERRRARIDQLCAGHGIGVEAWQALRRNPAAIAGAAVVAVVALVALLAPVLAPHGSGELIPQLQAQLRPDRIPGPQPGFLLGSDQLGRDLLSRMLLGARQTLAVGTGAMLVSLVLGGALGAVAGACGGRSSTLLMRGTDTVLAIPGLLMAVALALLAARPTAASTIIAVGVVGVPVFARLMCGAVVAQRGSDHVIAATVRGVAPVTVFVRHLLPGVLGPVLVQAPLTLATAVLDVAALAFLGIGDTAPGRAEWGLMLAQAQPYLDVRPMLAAGPAIALVVVVLGCTLLGESLRSGLRPRGRG